MPGAAPVVGGIQLERIVYRFYKGRLESVKMQYKGREAHRQMAVLIQPRGKAGGELRVHMLNDDDRRRKGFGK